MESRDLVFYRGRLKTGSLPSAATELLGLAGAVEAEVEVGGGGIGEGPDAVGTGVVGRNWHPGSRWNHVAAGIDNEFEFWIGVDRELHTSVQKPAGRGD